jgi:glyoxylase-like metal-dependent hydrolase (beta-lactamase superfamily II)
MTVRAVHHLNCATMCPVAAKWVAADMIAHVLLVETERDGLVLVDTGFGTRDCAGETPIRRLFKVIVRPALDVKETALERVKALGFAPSDVKHIVVTHLDLDHAGGLGDFPHAKVHLHTREHAAAMSRASRNERDRYVAAHWEHGPQWEVYEETGDTWRGLPAITRLRGLDADIGLVPMHGHTRGHSAVIVGAAKRWLVHAGDAYFHRGTVDDAAGKVPIGLRVFEKQLEMDGQARLASVAALRELRAGYDDVDMFSAHDMNELTAMQQRTGA